MTVLAIVAVGDAVGVIVVVGVMVTVGVIVGSGISMTVGVGEGVIMVFWRSSVWVMSVSCFLRADDWE